MSQIVVGHIGVGTFVLRMACLLVSAPAHVPTLCFIFLPPQCPHQRQLQRSKGRGQPRPMQSRNRFSMCLPRPPLLYGLCLWQDLAQGQGQGRGRGWIQTSWQLHSGLWKGSGQMHPPCPPSSSLGRTSRSCEHRWGKLHGSCKEASLQLPRFFLATCETLSS